jgi:hypothetical protein
VCWNADHSTVIRDADRVDPGSTVHVTLHRGEITCEVVAPQPKRS